MPRRDLVIAAAVMVFWGANFVVIDAGLDDVPPLLFAAVRFAIVAFPAVLFVRRPSIPFREVALVGLFMSLGQFAFLYLGLDAGMPAGLASLVVQAQMLFTIAIAIAFLGERPTPRQYAGAAIAMAGIAAIAVARGGSSVPVGAFLLCLCGAASWAVGNVVSRRAQAPDPFALLIWSAVLVPLPLAGLSLLVDGPHAIGHALAHWTLRATLSTLYTVVLCTWFGYGAWNWLLRNHPASKVSPFTLLVPPVGIAAAWIFDGERPTVVEIAGAVVVLAGLGLLSMTRPLPGRRRTVPAPEIA